MALIVLVSAALVALTLSGVLFPAGEAGHDDGSEHAGHDSGLVAGPVALRSLAGGRSVDVELTASAASRDGEATRLRAGGFANLHLTVTRAGSGEPLDAERPPVVWIDRRRTAQPGSAEPLSCRQKMRLYAGGTFGFQPQIDLSSYYIVTLNADASLSVIDPQGGVGSITSLYAMVELESPGQDWVASPDGAWLYVTMPDAGAVAVVDTETFEVVENIEAGENPVVAALQPGGRYLWVGNDSEDGRGGGVTVVDLHDLDIAASIETGAGHHDIVFPTVDEPRAGTGGDEGHSHDDGTPLDGDHVFVTNSASRTVSVVDVGSWERVADLDAGEVVAADYASGSGSLYLADRASGTVRSIDTHSLETTATLALEPGLTELRITPDGAWGFALNDRLGRLDIFDVTTNRVLDPVRVGGEPDQVSFSDDYAYVRSRLSAELTLVDLSRLGRAGGAPVVSVIGGQLAPGSAKAEAAEADAVVSHHGHGTLIANPADNYVYDYMEGMSSPMSGFTNYAPAARAVRVVDRGLHVSGPGEYDAQVRLPRAGRYQVAFLLDRPRVVHCFDLTVEPR